MTDPIKCSSCNRVMHPTEVLTRDLFSDSLGRCKSCVEKDAREPTDRSDIMDRFDDPEIEIRRGAR